MKDSTIEFTKRLFGSHAEATLKELEESHPELAKLIDDYAIGTIWSREGLSLREKSIATISTQIALRDWDQVEKHMQSFLHLGGSREELVNLLMHLTVYCGFPPIVKASRVMKEVLANSPKNQED